MSNLNTFHNKPLPTRPSCHGCKYKQKRLKGFVTAIQRWQTETAQAFPEYATIKRSRIAKKNNEDTRPAASEVEQYERVIKVLDRALSIVVDPVTFSSVERPFLDLAKTTQSVREIAYNARDNLRAVSGYEYPMEMRKYLKKIRKYLRKMPKYLKEIWNKVSPRSDEEYHDRQVIIESLDLSGITWLPKLTIDTSTTTCEECKRMVHPYQRIKSTLQPRRTGSRADPQDQSVHRVVARSESNKPNFCVLIGTPRPPEDELTTMQNSRFSEKAGYRHCLSSMTSSCSVTIDGLTVPPYQESPENEQCYDKRGTLGPDELSSLPLKLGEWLKLPPDGIHDIASMIPIQTIRSQYPEICEEIQGGRVSEEARVFCISTDRSSSGLSIPRGRREVYMLRDALYAHSNMTRTSPFTISPWEAGRSSLNPLSSINYVDLNVHVF